MSRRGRRASSVASTTTTTSTGTGNSRDHDHEDQDPDHDQDEHDDDDDQEDDQGPAPGAAPPKKKKKPDPGEVCQLIYETIRCYKKPDGTLLCDAFIRAPKRRQEPHYYEVVSQPIDLLRVQQKLKTDSYEDVDELAADMELLVSNAKAFYKSDTVEYKDAVSLWNLFIQTKQSLENASSEDIKLTRAARLAGTSTRKSANSVHTEEDLSEVSSLNNEDEEIYEEFFVSVMSAQADNNRPLHAAFLNLPSKKRYPEYYEVIKQPIDLKMIANKVQNCEYTDLGQMEKDFALVTKNACAFNEPGSQIYKDARAFKKVVLAKKIEIEHGRSLNPKASERIRSKRAGKSGSNPVSSAAIAASRDSEEEDSDDDEKGNDSDSEGGNSFRDNPQWKLFTTIKDFPSSNGSPMSEPFWKLPSRRLYPDYYKEIKNPIALAQIKKKIREGDYGTLSEVAGDMNIMFENAKAYNVSTSKLYKDAVKLQRLMQQRVQELLDISQDTSSEDESLSSVKSVGRGRGRPRVNPIPTVTPSQTSSSPGKINPILLPLKKKMHLLQKHLIDYACPDGRQPLLLFMEKPSKKLYPDYYNVIEKPIDMLTIEANIKNDRYSTLDQIVADFRLMFNNCRQYNEERSLIYEDANTLEKALNEKLKELTGINPAERKTPVKSMIKTKVKQISANEQKLRTLYDTIRDYRDAKSNRQLALIFMKLPNKSEYPDYYDLIKIPIDMEKIAHKLKINAYASVNDLASDFILMFDNACKYNEPDSSIYKDALALQKLCLQTKQQLKDDEDTVPDVPRAVHELLLTLFSTVYNHEDEEGRCYSDSLVELPEYDEVNGNKVKAISLDIIKRRLDRGLYKRLDYFQEDMFAVWERARNISRSDSQVFEDSIEMQMFYIKTRDELCKNGEVFSSPALKVKKEDAMAPIEVVRQCKLLEEASKEDEDDENKVVDEIPAGAQNVEQAQYKKGDCVYINNKKQLEPIIMQIERIWNNSDNVVMVYGNIYYKPSETYHPATRKFLEQEVFKTDSRLSFPVDHISGKCYIMNVKDYIKLKPEGFADKDIFVCESRYNTKTKAFKKIKMWPTPSESNVPLVEREEPLEVKRIMSVFRERIEKQKDEPIELDIMDAVQERERANVVVYNPLGSDDENTYYEQYNTVCSGVIKTGDYVYVVTDGGKQMIAQVDAIWETKDGKCYFRGPWLIFPSEVVGIINKAFYKQEVFLTAVHDSSPLVGIVGKCAVLHYDEYLKCRPTEVPEADVYVCESLYDESNRVSKKLSSGLRKYEHTDAVTIDEIYFFSRPLGPPQLANMQEISGLGGSITASVTSDTVNFIVDSDTMKSEDVEMYLDNSMDESSMQSPGTPMSLGMSLTGPSTPAGGTPGGSKKIKKDTMKLVTGYVLYSCEVRKAIAANHPESSFGEISRIVGNEWRSLSAATKQSWEEKASKVNDDSSAKWTFDITDAQIIAAKFEEKKLNNPDYIFECCWDTCDYQFEDFTDCTEHIIADGFGHIQQFFSGGPKTSDGGYQCLWRNCTRMKRLSTSTPFPNLPRLIRHVREIHINKSNGRSVPPSERSKNFVLTKNRAKPSVVQHRPQPPPGQTVTLSQLSPLSRGTPSPAPQVIQPQMPGVRVINAEPLFVSVPPRPHRVQHSEAYIKYIEGLHSEQKYISPWERTMAPLTLHQAEIYHTGSPRIPVHWVSDDLMLGMNADNPAPEPIPPNQNPKVIRALWNLRELMLRDAFAISKNL